MNRKVLKYLKNNEVNSFLISEKGSLSTNQSLFDLEAPLMKSKNRSRSHSSSFEDQSSDKMDSEEGNETEEDEASS